ncbi:MAG: hypothetical protein WD534_04885 [Phycisphaeraceae bacterium]
MQTTVTGVVGGLLLVTALWTGCAFKGGDGGLLGNGNDVGIWQPRAELLRVHPSTRFVADADQRATLQARVELLDAMNDSIKATGEYRLELLASDEMGRNVGRRLYQWQVDARTLEQQRSYYDSVTRAYLFRLRLDQPSPPDQPMLLRVTFVPAERGARLEGSTVITP